MMFYITGICLSQFPVNRRNFQKIHDNTVFLNPFSSHFFPESVKIAPLYKS